MVLGRTLLTEPRVLFLDEPTRGIDVGARLEIYEIINRLTGEGRAVVLVSSELPELIGMSDRILMLHEGRLTGEFTRADATPERLLEAAMGQMLQMNSGFLDKLIERIGRVRPEDLQSYLLRLADEKGFLETIFNAIHEGVIVTDLQGRVNYLNRSACELFGLERDEAQGRAIGERLRGLDWEKMTRSKTVMSRDMEIFYPQHRFLNFYVVPLFLEKPGGKPRKLLNARWSGTR